MRLGTVILAFLLLLATPPAWCESVPDDVSDLVDDGATSAELETAPILAGNQDGALRWSLRRRWVNGRVSWRGLACHGESMVHWNRNGEGEARLAVELNHASWRMIGGGWRLSSPAGWIAAGAGRSRTPSVASSSLSQSVAFGPDDSTWRERPVIGLALDGRHDQWHIVGARGTETKGSLSARMSAANVSRQWGKSGVALMMVRRDSNLGVSGSGRWAGPNGHVAGDGAGVDSGHGRDGALHIGVSWRAGRLWRFSADAAWAGESFGACGGGRNGLIPGDAGRGWAWRSAWRPSGNDWRISSVMAVGQASAANRGPGETDHRDILGVRLKRSVNANLEFSARVRLLRHWRLGWSDRPAWEAPGMSRLTRDETVAIGGKRKSSSGSVSVDLRRRRRLDDQGEARRFLLQAGWNRHLGKTGSVHARWLRAWGDQLDLVTVVSPVPGEVLIQHWGVDQEGLAVGWKGPLFTGDVAVSAWRRLRADEIGAPMEFLLTWTGRGSLF